MLKMDIKITAATEDEFVFALQDLLKKVEDGDLYGFGKREDGISGYTFETDGDESDCIVCKECEIHNYFEDEAPETCCYCGKDL